MSPRRSLARAAALAVLAALASCSPAAAAPAITESTPTGLAASSVPQGAVRGPDGSVWFVENHGSGAVDKITPQGTLTRFTLNLSSNPGLRGITVGPDGNLWFTENATDKIGKITPGGTIVEYPLASNAAPVEIATGSDGNLWFTQSGAIGRITPGGQVTTFTIGLSGNTQPTGITAGPDGNLWFTSRSGFGKIGRVTTSGVITEVASAKGQPQDITAGPDGNLWFTEAGSFTAIGKIAPSGQILAESTAGVTASSAPGDIVVGGDGRLYFAERNGVIGAISTSGGPAIEYGTASGLTAGSAPFGIAAGGDGDIWFTESGNTARVGRLTAPPRATTDSPTALASTTATLAGTVTPTSLTSTYYFEYGPVGSSYTQTSIVTANTSAGTPQAVTANLTGLTASTAYHFHVVASNAAGTTTGDDQTFTTGGPLVDTLAAGSIGATSAQLSGTVNPNGTATTYHFEWGTTTAYTGQQVPAGGASAGSGTVANPATQLLGGLTPGTTYHYRLVASNTAGPTYGADQTFTTTTPTPDVTTGAAADVTSSSATLAGKVDAHGVATTYRFEWGTTAAYGNQVPAADAAVGAANPAKDLTKTLTGLAPATTYHFRLVATSAGGTVDGADATFTTGEEERRSTAATDDGAATEDDAPADDDPLAAPAPGPRLPAPGAPVINKSVNVAKTSGTVTVRLPGATKALPLDAAGARVPVGSVVDATQGHITLRSVKDTSKATQTGSFWGGRFVVTQPKGPKPVTVLALAKSAERCATTKAVAAAVRAKRKPKRGKDVLNRIWGRDNHGSFSTTGRYAAATVRGTEWLTADRCDGTLISVARGAVLVTNKRTHRKILVRAGQSYLARAPR